MRFTTYKPAWLVLLCAAGPVFAQANLDSGAILRESQSVPPPVPQVVPPKPVAAMPVVQGPKVFVRFFIVEGSSRFTAPEWQIVLQDFAGRELTFAELQAVADKVSLHYREAGLHALAVLPEQSLQDGLVRILVVEGKLGRSRFEYPAETTRVPKELLSEMIGKGQEAGQILRVDALERATLIANDLPGLKVSTVLQAGERAGETDIVAQVQVQPILVGNVSMDNFDPVATGRFKTAAAISLNNPFGAGEQFLLSTQITEGKHYGSMGFNTPLNADGLRAGGHYSKLDYTLLGTFAATGGKGNAETWGGNLSYPFIRQQQTNLIGQVSYTASHLVNDSSAGNLSDKTDHVWSVGLNINHNDAWLGGGVSLGGVTYSLGVIDLNGNASDLAHDQAGVKRNGHYSKLSYNAARLQRISERGSLWLSTNGQVAFKNLDSGEEFSLGGPNGIRAYPGMEGAGDEGQIVTMEYRHELPYQVQGKLFYDWGWTRINHDNHFSGGATRNVYSLEGVGLGLDWSPYNQITLRSSLAWRVGNNPAAQANGRDSDGSKRMPQFWLYAQFDF